MVQKIPPPPLLTSTELQALNRWLLEIQSILSNAGNIDPSSVAGLPEVIAESAQNTTDIADLTTTVSNLSLNVDNILVQIAGINAQITTINGQLTTLGARGELLFGAGAPAAGLGKVNDWYGDTAGAAGARVWIKKAVGTWVAFPF